MNISYAIKYNLSSAKSGVTASIGDTSLYFSVVNVNLNYSGSSTVDVMLPGLDQLGAINEEGTTRMRVSANGVTLISATLQSVEYSQSPSSAQVSLSAAATKDYSKSGSVTVTDIFSTSSSGGVRSFRAAANVAVRPGALVTTPYDTFRCGEVSFSLGPSQWEMQVTELTAADEQRKSQVTAAGLLSGNRNGSAPAAA